MRCVIEDVLVRFVRLSYRRRRDPEIFGTAQGTLSPMSDSATAEQSFVQRMLLDFRSARR